MMGVPRLGQRHHFGIIPLPKVAQGRDPRSQTQAADGNSSMAEPGRVLHLIERFRNTGLPEGSSLYAKWKNRRDRRTTRRWHGGAPALR